MAKILLYLNQFFAGIGGEDKADQAVIRKQAPVGSGIALAKLVQSSDVEFCTLICGDNYFHEHEVEVQSTVFAAVNEFRPEIFIAGPAFNAGRYGLACAKACSWVQESFRIPTITAMHADNPGTKEVGRLVYVIEAADSTANMQQCLKRYAELIGLIRNDDSDALKNFRAEYCLQIPRRFTVRSGKPDYVRATDMLLAKLSGAPYEGEIPQVKVEPHRIPNLRVDLKDAILALVTEGGLVPAGNPDRLESTRGSKFLKYSIAGRDDLAAGEFQAMHTGYNTVSVDQDPDRIVPVDAMRQLEQAQRFKKLHDDYFVTTGTGAMPSKMEELGTSIADELKAQGIDGVILTAT